MLTQALPDYAVTIKGPSWWRGDRRVADACRGAGLAARRAARPTTSPRSRLAIDRLQTVCVADGKAVARRVLGRAHGHRTAARRRRRRHLLCARRVQPASRRDRRHRAALRCSSACSARCFLYYGLKAVQLTEMANRVWKRTRRIQPDSAGAADGLRGASVGGLYPTRASIDPNERAAGQIRPTVQLPDFRRRRFDTGKCACSQALMPPAISLTFSNPWRCSTLAAIAER